MGMMELERAVALQCIHTLSFEQKMRVYAESLGTRQLIMRYARDPYPVLRGWESYLRWLAEPVHHALTIDDSSYPPLLCHISDPPLVLSMTGRPLHIIPAVSIVGTRRAGKSALEAASRLAAECARAGIPVISGFARGIDQAAQFSCLEHGGESWAVMGCGLDHLRYLRRDLVLRFLLRGGTFLSEYHPFAEPLPWRFPPRNRIISGISAVTVVIQAPLRSGSLITARHALDQGRDVLVHRVGLEGESGCGSAALAQEGAPVVSCLEDVLRESRI